MSATVTFTINGLSSTTIPELLVTKVHRPLVPNKRDSFVDVPGREGFWFFEEKAGPRTITIEFDVLAASFVARRAAVIALADLLDQAGMVSLIFSDEPDRFHRVHLASNPDPDELLTHAALSVDFTAEPYSQLSTPTTETWTAASGVTHTWTPADKVYGIPELELTAIGGTVTSFSILANGVTFVYAVGTGLTAGQVVTVSTLAYVLTRGTSGDPNLDGTFVAANLDMATVSGDFPYIVVGLNSYRVTFTGTAGTVGVTVRWRRRNR